jgi:hypothetical protein
MHQAVVQPAQGDEVGEFGLPAVGPVLDVVPIDIALVAFLIDITELQQVAS